MSLVGFENRENGYNKIIDPDQDIELYKKLMADVAGWRYLGEVSDVSLPDVVNHPPHYTSHPSGIEVIQIAEHMCFNVGNCIKYAMRAGLKGGSEKYVQDLEKARWYLDREIKRFNANHTLPKWEQA